MSPGYREEERQRIMADTHEHFRRLLKKGLGSIRFSHLEKMEADKNYHLSLNGNPRKRRKSILDGVQVPLIDGSECNMKMSDVFEEICPQIPYRLFHNRVSRLRKKKIIQHAWHERKCLYNVNQVRIALVATGLLECGDS